MTRKNLGTMAILAVLAVVTALPAAAQRGAGPGTCTRLANLPVGSLNADETAGLVWVREEEKLARDVYTTLYADWQAREFLNIAASEQRHMDAVKALLDRYGVTDPVGSNPVGVFTNPELQALYDDLVAQGRLSLVAALTVGATIEDLDLVDVQAQLAEADDVDLDTVYQNLAKGSRNHLRAFVAALAAEGATYAPQYLDADAFAAIVASAWERGPVDAAGNPVPVGGGRGSQGAGQPGGGNGGVCDGTGPAGSGNGGNGGNGNGGNGGAGNGGNGNGGNGGNGNGGSGNGGSCPNQ